MTVGFQTAGVAVVGVGLTSRLTYEAAGRDLTSDRAVVVVAAVDELVCAGEMIVGEMIRVDEIALTCAHA